MDSARRSAVGAPLSALGARLSAITPQLAGAALILASCAEFAIAPDQPSRDVRAIRLDSLSFTLDDGSTVPLTATVLDQTGTAITELPTGLKVTWSTSAPDTVAIDANGVATAERPGTAKVSAQVSGNFGSVSASADVRVRAVPTDMTLEQGDAQNGFSGEPVATKPRVRVVDRHGNGVPDVPMMFAVTAGGGTVESANVMTDATGVVETGWTLGTVAGANTLQVRFAPPRLPNKVVTFTATGLPGAVSSLVKVSGDGQTSTNGSTLQPFVARVTDRHGNALAGVNVQWAVTGGGTLGGALSSAAGNTDASGLASTTLTLGGVGAYQVTASVGGVLLVAYTATAVSPSISLPNSIATTGATSIVSGSTTIVTFVARDIASNPLPTGGLDVVFAVRAGPAGTSTGTISATTDHGNGTYTATFTGVLAGTPAAIDISVGGQAFASPPQVSVTAGAASVATSVVTVSTPVLAVGGTATLRLQARDANGNALTSGGLAVVFGTSGAGTSAGIIGPTTDAGDGTYTAQFTAQTDGTAISITALLNGQPVTAPLPTIQVVPAVTGAAVRWIAASASWGLTSAWDLGRLPLASDTAYIDAPGSYIVAVDQAVGIAKLVAGSGSGATVVNVSGQPVGVSDSVVIRPAAMLGLRDASSLTVPALFVGGTLELTAAELFAAVRNEGTIVVTAAGATAVSSVTGAIDNRGTLNLLPGAILAASNGTVMLGATGTLTGTGTLDATNAGGVQLSGAITPAGTASVGTLSIAGALTANGTGPRSIAIELSSAAPGGYDQLVITGAATLTGATLNVNTINGFVPAPGQSFIVLTHGSRTGNFASIDLPTLPAGGARWQVTHGQTELVLSIVMPTPTQLAFTTQPSNATAGTFVLPAPVVEIRDAAGDVVTGATDQVTLTVVDAGGTPTGQTFLATAVAGVATFDNVALTIARDHRLVATSGSLTQATSALFSVLPGAPASLTQLDGDGQAGAAGQQLAQPLRVRLFDGFGNGVPGATVNFAITAGAGSVGSPSALTGSGASAGIASTTWTLGAPLGAQSAQATSGALAPVVFDATSIAGPAARLAFVVQPSGALVNSAISPAMQVRIEDALGNPVTATDAVTLAIANNAGGGALTGTLTRAAVAGIATFPGIAITQPGAGYTLTATAAGLADATSAAFSIASAPAITLSMGGNNVVGVLGEEVVTVTLNAPAPAGGLSVSVTSDNTGVVSVQAPATATIAAGATTGQVTIAGVALGNTTLRGNALGHQEGTLNVAATNQIISLPTTLNVPFGQQVSIPVTLAVPAPAGGVTVTLTTADASRVGVVMSTVTFPAGTQLQNGTVAGVAPGSAIVRATAPGWAADASTVSTTAQLNIVESSTFLNPVFPSTISVEFRSGGVAVAAPAGGITVTLTPANPACAAVTSPLVIPQGQVNVIATVSYGGTATLPCNTSITATSPDLVSDNVTVNVSTPPAITLSTLGPLGSGLQMGSTGQLAVAPPGGTTVRLTSADPSLFRLSSSPSVPGASNGILDLTLNPGVNQLSYYIQAMEGVTGTATITASAPNFTNGTQTITVVTPALQLGNVSTSYTTLSPDAAIYASIGVGTASQLSTTQAIRAGGTAVTVTFASSNVPVAQLRTQTIGAAATQTATIVPGQSNSPTSLALGGVALTAFGAGTTNISATIPGFTSTTAATRAVTVAAPVITLNAPGPLGLGLQTTVTGSISVQAPAGDVVVHLASTDAARLLVTPNVTTPGTAAIDVVVREGTQTFNFVVQAVEGMTPDTVAVNATATGFTGGTMNVSIHTPRLQVNNLSSTYTTLSPVAPLYVSIGTGNTSNLTATQPVRAGGTAVVATVTNSNATVGRLDSASASAQSFLVTIGPGQSNSPMSLAAGGIGFHPLAGGSTTVSASIPGYATTAAASRAITVTSATINVASLPPIGSGLQVGGTASLSSAAPAGGLVVHLVSSDPSRLRLAPNATTVGSSTGTLDVTVPAGTFSFGYTAQAMEGATGDVTITASAAGYDDRTITVTLATPLLQISNTSSSYTTLTNNAPFWVSIGVGATATNTSAITTSEVIRAGGVAVSATIVSSSPTVAQLVTTTTAGNSATVTINPGQSQSPSTVAAGGVAVDPLSTGTTTLTATIPGYIGTTAATRPISVTTPVINLGSPGSLGSGLQTIATGSLSTAAPTGGVTIQLVSSDSSRLLLAPNATTVGSGTVNINVPQGQVSFTYVVQAIENLTPVTLTVTASTSGYVDGTANVPIVTPVLQLNSVPSTITASAANVPIQVAIGTGNTNNITSSQAVRAGGPTLTATISNSQASVAQLAKTGLTAQSVTVSIAAGQFNSPNTVALGGAAFDPLAAGSTSVSATIPGFTPTLAATRAVTVNP